ncbi:MAG: hypothetical protein AB1847_13825 [bacterium]
MKFKVLEWIRKVRDEEYKETKNLHPKEKIEHTKKMAKVLLRKYYKGMR